jgi:SAM-dependent methyltransferase
VIFDDVKARQAMVWGSGPYERIAETLAPMHDAVVSRLAPRSGELWLDVATGTGGVAMRAAKLGARVTGVDLAPALIETARRLAVEQNLKIDFDVGDAEHLPYPDAAFTVVSSAVGVVFARDHSAVARELARVSRSGGRLGVTGWRPEGGVGDFFRVMSPFQEPQPENAASPFDWGREQYVTELLGSAYELEFDELDSPYRCGSGKAAWDELSSSYGPTKSLADSLDDGRRAELRRAVVEFYERLRDESGIRHSRTYLLTLGRRR